MKILVTGVAGFIGYHLIKRLGEMGVSAIGLDSINDYYDVNLKYDRLRDLGFSVAENDLAWNESINSRKFSNLTFIRLNLANRSDVETFFKDNKFHQVVHLAAQPGVRYSLENPHAYIDSNVVSFMNILEGCRSNQISQLLYASSSSVYGQNAKIPFSEEDRVDEPISLYAATKKSNELMAYTYSHLFGIQSIGLRFFTVYGPWGRPDMAPMLFANSAIKGKPIKVYNHGDQSRDFTYVDDIVEGIVGAMQKGFVNGDANNIVNIGHGSPVSLMDFIETLEKKVGTPIAKEYVDAQPGDVPRTYADTSRLSELIGKSKTKTSLEVGIDHFVKWYKDYYKSEK